MMTATGKTTIKKKNKKEVKPKVNSESKCESCASGEGLTLETLNCKLNRLLDIVIEKEASEINNTNELVRYMDSMYTKLSNQMIETEELVNINCDDIQNTIENEDIATRGLVTTNGNVLFDEIKRCKNDIKETCVLEGIATRDTIWDRLFNSKIVNIVNVFTSSIIVGLLIYMLLTK